MPQTTLLHGDESFISFDIPLDPSVQISDIKNNSILNDNETAFGLFNTSKNILSPINSTMTVSSSLGNETMMTVLRMVLLYLKPEPLMTPM